MGDSQVYEATPGWWKIFAACKDAEILKRAQEIAADIDAAESRARDRSRRREAERRRARDREIRALLEAALRKLEEGSP
jgi:hypothetical protein